MHRQREKLLRHNVGTPLWRPKTMADTFGRDKSRPYNEDYGYFISKLIFLPL